MTQTPTPVVFNETQKIPMMHISSGGDDIIHKITLLDNEFRTQSCTNKTEIQSIKDSQTKIDIQIKQLVDMCLQINQLVTDVKDKLSQYDIDDVDDDDNVSVVCDTIEDDEQNELENQPNDDVFNNTNEIKTKSGSLNPINIDDIEYFEEIDDKKSEPEICDNRTDDLDKLEVVDNKPKRKYNRRKN